MDYGRLLTRSFEVMWRHRVLWVFGILLALTGGSSASFNFQFPGNYTTQRGEQNVFPSLPSGVVEKLAAIVAVAICVLLIWIVLSTILRIMSRGALIGLVQELETQQGNPTVRRGFAIGSERFLPLLGISLIVNLPVALLSFLVALAVAVALILALAPILSGSGTQPSGQMILIMIGGIFAGIAGICLIGLTLFVISLVIRPLFEFFVRVCVIQHQPAIESIKSGFQLVRDNIGRVIFLYILILGIGIAFGILMIPVGIVLFGIPAAAAFTAHLATNSLGPTIAVGAVLGIPALLVFLFISGLYSVYESTLWTEGFLAIVASPPKPTAVQG